jgi:SAM-dependent methyltransferase
LSTTAGSKDSAPIDVAKDIDGYVTGITYPQRYYREINPAALAFAALQCGYAAPRLDQPFRYMDLGCGHGYSTTLCAALFPQGQFIGIDFNPDHIASAEKLRLAARIENATFLATTFAAMANDQAGQTGDCDFIVMHGVMSWVSEAVQRDIALLIERRLKPGGLLYVSYNCQPGWAAKMPLRELLADAYQLASGKTVADRLHQAVSLLRQLADSGAQYFTTNPGVMPLIELIEQQDAGYLAHEFLNRHWTVFHHRDMAAKMTSIGLDYLGSANAADNIRLLAMPEKPAALIAAIPDLVMRETMRDLVLDRQFRRDIYGRNLKPLRLSEFVSALKNTHFVQARSRDDCSLTIKRSFGDVHLDAAIFDPLLDRLAQGPASFDELCQLAPLDSWTLADQNQAIQVLVGAGFARPVVGGASVAADNDAVRRFNEAALAAAVAAGRDQVTLAVTTLSDAVVAPLVANGVETADPALQADV